MATATQSERTTESCRWPTMESVEQNMRQARQVVETARHAARHAVADAESNVRRHPLQAVGVAAAVSVVIGGLLGFGAGWFVRARR